MRKGVWIGTVPGGLSDEGLTLANACGFSGVELATLDDEGARQSAADLVREHGLVVSGIMNQAHWEHPLSDPSAKVRSASVAGLVSSIDSASATGADTVLLVPAVVTRQVPYEQAWIRSQAEILDVLERAASSGVTIALENVWNRFLLSPLEFARYVDQFCSPYVTAYFDVGNICLYGYPEQWIRYLGQRIRRVHIKGFDSKTRRFTPTLTGGDIEWDLVVSALDEIGYAGWLTAEMPVQQDDPHGGFMALSDEMDCIFGDRFR